MAEVQQRQTDRVVAAAARVPSGDWQRMARHGPVVRRIPLRQDGTERPSGIATQAIPHDTDNTCWVEETEGTYKTRHSGNGMSITVWLVRPGKDLTIREQTAVDASKMVNAEAAAEAREIIMGEGLVNFQTELCPDEVLLVKLAAGGRLTVDATHERCEVVAMGECVMRLHLPIQATIQTLRRALPPDARIQVEGAVRGYWLIRKAEHAAGGHRGAATVLDDARREVPQEHRVRDAEHGPARRHGCDPRVIPMDEWARRTLCVENGDFLSRESAERLHAWVREHINITTKRSAESVAVGLGAMGMDIGASKHPRGRTKRAGLVPAVHGGVTSSGQRAKADPFHSLGTRSEGVPARDSLPGHASCHPGRAGAERTHPWRVRLSLGTYGGG